MVADECLTSILNEDKAENHACVWKLKNDQKWSQSIIYLFINWCLIHSDLVSKVLKPQDTKELLFTVSLEHLALVHHPILKASVCENQESISNLCTLAFHMH